MKVLLTFILMLSFSLSVFPEEECDMSVDKEVITLVIEATKKIQACIEKESVKDCLKENKFDFKIKFQTFETADEVTACLFVPKSKEIECGKILNTLYKSKDLEERRKLLAGKDRDEFFDNFIFRNVFYVPNKKMLQDDVVIEPCLKTEQIEKMEKLTFSLLFANYNDKYRFLPHVKIKKNIGEHQSTRFVIEELIYQVPPLY